MLKKVFLRVRDDGRFVYSKGYTTEDVGGSRETLRKHENILVHCTARDINCYENTYKKQTKK